MDRLARPLEASVDSLLARVRRFLAEMLGDGAPSLGAIAQRLHMSPRTLQRRLELDGTSFHVLAGDVRRERALAYLADPKLPLAEVAFLLGFSAPSAFHRAFRKWTGRTPLQHRRSVLARRIDGRPWGAAAPASGPAVY